MSVNLFDKEFYPTPDHVIRKMVQPYIESKEGLRKMQILEPSAGSGAILDYISKERTTYSYWQADKANVYALERKREHPYGFTATAEDYKALSLPTAINMVKVGDSSLHESAFFQFRCYKKGTLHIVFKDDDIWARFNLTVNEGKMELGHFSK